MTDEIHNYSELLELAVLDAHGLLEPIESELFNRSFHEAPASMQDEIIRMQHEFATDESLLPEDLPTAELRKKVLDAVANAADKEASTLAPLALIGARVGVTKGRVSSSGSVVVWRIAAMILFGVSVVLAIVALDVGRTATSITQKAENVVANDSLKNLTDTEFVEFINNPYYQVTRLARSEGNQAGYIRVAIYSEPVDGIDPSDSDNPNTRGYVFGLDLEDGEKIVIQGITESGTVIRLAVIVADDSVVAQSFEIPKHLAQGLRIEGFDVNTGARWI